MTVFLTVLGAVLVLAALRDIFHEIFHPSGAGSLSGVLMRVVWRSFRRLAGRRAVVLSLAGPLSLVAIIVSWAALLAVGWALVYLPYMPDNFLYQTGLKPQMQDGFIGALYYSLTTLATLGYGDIVPTNGPLRVLAPIEAITGFGLLTAGLTWVLSIYPALNRRRSLAQEVAVIREAESESGIDVTGIDAVAAKQTLHALASQLMAVRGDLQTYSVTYYFHSSDEKSGISAALLYLADLAERGGASDRPREVRLGATMLRRALDDLAQVVGSRFLGLSSAPTDKVLAAYARDHFRDAPGGGEEPS